MHPQGDYFLIDHGQVGQPFTKMLTAALLQQDFNDSVASEPLFQAAYQSLKQLCNEHFSSEKPLIYPYPGMTRIIPQGVVYSPDLLMQRRICILLDHLVHQIDNQLNPQNQGIDPYTVYQYLVYNPRIDRFDDVRFLDL